MNQRNEGTAFVIGEDLALYGAPLPEDASAAMRRGYQHEHEQARRPRVADRYVRKWLQLRLGAWRRSRMFDVSVTPGFLRHIDRATCPVSGVVLTHGTKADTDWSVDRLDNDAAYAAHNLVVLSTRVNRAKGALTVAEIARIASLRRSQGELAAGEWERLADLVSFTTEAAELVVRPVLSYRCDHLPVPHLRLFLHELLNISQQPAAMRKGSVQMMEDHGRACLEQISPLLEALRHYAAATPPSQRNLIHWMADDSHWDTAKAFWTVFIETPGYVGWQHAYARLLAGEVARGLVPAPKLARVVRQEVYKETAGYC